MLLALLLTQGAMLFVLSSSGMRIKLYHRSVGSYHIQFPWVSGLWVSSYLRQLGEATVRCDASSRRAKNPIGAFHFYRLQLVTEDLIAFDNLPQWGSDSYPSFSVQPDA